MNCYSCGHPAIEHGEDGCCHTPGPVCICSLTEHEVQHECYKPAGS